MKKYSKEGPFEDPIMRCDSCQALIKRDSIQHLGMCSECGNKRFRNVLILTEEEQGKLVGMGIDPEWLNLFAPVEGT